VLVLANQTPGLRERVGLSRVDVDRAAWTIDADGGRYAGAAAANRVLRELPGWRWFAGLYSVPPVRWLEDKVYQWIAAHRGWFERAGELPECSRPGVECLAEDQ
jgi:predicted DCC family thiol-disulfide oxidoreductase YuxK